MKTLFDDGYTKVGVDEGEEGIILWIEEDYGGDQRGAMAEMAPADLMELGQSLTIEALRRMAKGDE